MKNYLFMTLATLLLPVAAFAVDGQMLINQSTVAAAGGFPYKITQPGSYKLSGNLVVPGSASGIQITVSNVTLDLNGFAITGGASGFPPPHAISAVNGVVSVTIRNGQINGYYSPIDPAEGQYWTLEDLIFVMPSSSFATLDYFVTLGAYARVWHVTGPGGTLKVGCPSIVSESIFDIIEQNTSVTGSRSSCTFVNNSTL